MNSRNLNRKTCWVTLSLAMCAVASFSIPALTDCLQLKVSPEPGLSVTSLTCHLTHWSFDQLFWDLSAFAVLGCLCESRNRNEYLGLLLGSAFAVSWSVMVFHPEVQSYRGLSGVDSALFVFLACVYAAEGFVAGDRKWLWGLGAWTVFVGKIIYELHSHQSLFVDAADVFQPLPTTHAAGAVAGTLVFATFQLRNSRRSREHVLPSPLGHTSS